MQVTMRNHMEAFFWSCNCCVCYTSLWRIAQEWTTDS